MAYILPIVLLCCGIICLGHAYSGPDLPPGPYCGKTGLCCPDRQDGCAHKILGSMCYCDQFCNRNHDDCCPDYNEVCLGVKPTPPPSNIVKACTYRGNPFNPGETRMEGCNKCECVFPESPETNHWRCEQDDCIISEDVLQRVQRSHYGWRAYNYTEFQDKKLKDGLIYKLGTLPLTKETMRMGPITYDKDIKYPLDFDARDHWPGYISPVVDQGWCGSDWAVSLATVVSDRLAIQSNGAEKVILSPQTLLSCSRSRQQGCHGGHLDVAWIFAKNHGLVDEDCFPYQAKTTSCPFRKSDNLAMDGCKPVNPQRTSRYRVGPPGKLVNVRDIMYEIMQSGPVQAIMRVYQDFFHYRDGIYRRSHSGNNELSGYHSVRIIGWGEENGEKYWVVANSWGPEWGENGYFRILRGVNESGIESFIVIALNEITEAYRRK